MSAVKKTINKKNLRNFIPLDKLSIDKLDELIDKSIVEELPAGRVIFRQGEKDKRNIYLIEGQVELQITGNTKGEVVKAKTMEAKYPLADTLPRPSTCRARTSVTLLIVDTDHLEILLEHDPSGTYEVTELGMEDDSEDNTDWMLRFLQSRAFLQLPTANIQGLLMRLEEQAAKKGEVILQQGGKDDYYYIVKQGKCAVSRRPAPQAEDVRLAILSVGDGFGEEALITSGRRNATVTMQEDGTLMRLHKKDFMELLVEPLIKYTDLTTATTQAKQHATLIDVRTNKAFSKDGLQHASNIPLSMLRVKLSTLNPTSDYILYCDDGSQSAAAAFLMIQQGLKCKVIRNGIGGASSNKKANNKAKDAATNVVELTQATPKTTAKEARTKTPEANPDQVKFERHRRQAQEEARKAEAAEVARKAAEHKTQQLKSEADKLRQQAERLASKTASAESARKQAEAEINRIKADAEGMRQQAAQDSQKMRKEAEKLRLQAEQELSKIKQEAASIESQQEAIEQAAREAAQMAELRTQEAEQAQRQAKAEAERVKAEAEAIRQAALEEADRLKQEMSQARKNAAKLEAEEAARREAEIIAARQRAEQAIQQAAQAAEEAKKQAALEAEAIRQKAQEEAERTRREAEQAAHATTERAEASQRQQQALLEKARRQAEETLKETNLAAEEARRQAEQEAEQIRQQALEEAEQLRQEMESTRKLIEEEAARAKARISEDSQRHQVEEQRRREAEQATQRQQAAEEAARREAAERQAAEEASRREQHAMQEKAEQARQLAESKKHDEQHARELAEAIMQKLSEAEASRKADEGESHEGLHVAKATIRRVKDRTILEGDEDIFIFKEPKAHDFAEDDDLFNEVEPETRRAKGKQAQQTSQEDDELPSFLVEPQQSSGSQSGMVPELRVNVADYEHSDGGEKTTSNNRKQLYALAASVTIMIAVGIYSFNSQSMDPLEELATSSQPAKEDATAATKIKTDNMASFGKKSDSKQEEPTEAKGESKVKKLLSRWKEKLLDDKQEK